MSEETETTKPADVAGRLDGLVGRLLHDLWPLFEPTNGSIWACYNLIFVYNYSRN